MQDVGAQQPLIGDRYRVLKKIGEGGMGEVYLAEHIYIEKRVAIKLLRPDVLSNQEAVSRFRQEARSASSIGHENIIQIDDFGTLPDGRIYMAMEFLQGEPLNEMLAHGPLPLPRALDILIQVTRALAAAHAKGITHRDMKPENIFVTNRDGRDVPKVLDFGIAKVSGGDTGQNLTIAGSIFGTPFYMAPEQAMGGKMDHRVDVYAMGIILYEIFCGTVPFKAETFMGILTQHITTEPTPPSQMAAMNGRIVQPQLEAIILKAMRKNVDERYQTMNEMVGALIDFYRFSVGTPISGYQTVVKPPGGKQPGRKLVPILLGATAVSAGLGILIWRLTIPSPVALPPVPDAGKVVAVVPDAAVPRPHLSPPDAAPIIPSGPPDAGRTNIVEGPPDAGEVVGPRVVRVWLRSEPSGAKVVGPDGNEIGKTPMQVTVTVGKTETFTLKLPPDYYNKTVKINGTRTTIMAELEPTGLKP